MSSERPILFSGEMVRAILAGKKTQTRRVVIYKREQPPTWATFVNHLMHPNMDMKWVKSNLFQWSEEQTEGKTPKKLRRWPTEKLKVTRSFSTDSDIAIPCPYGKPGDSLWVRETWAYGCSEDAPKSERLAVYRADLDEFEEATDEMMHKKYPALASTYKFNRWRPSIHMPRWASRIDLEIVSIRVERIQEIGGQDVKAEGVEFAGEELRETFQKLWNSINESRGFGWDKNPWVWVIEFSVPPRLRGESPSRAQDARVESSQPSAASENEDAK